MLGLGFIGFSFARVREDHTLSLLPKTRNQPPEEERRHNRTCKLGKKEKRHIQRSDAGECVAERPSNCDGRIGKRR